MMRTATCAIVDDEPLARELLRTCVQRDPRLQLVGEASDGRQALGLAARSKPELLFLDVQMPELDAFDLLDELHALGITPIVVFVTAYDQFALQALERSAVDYILKPFDFARFSRAVDAALARLSLEDRAEYADRIRQLMSQRPRRLPVRTGGRILLLPIEEIDWIEGSGNYVCLHVGNLSHRMRGTLTALERRLVGLPFVRIHRSVIVNSERIANLESWYTGEYIVRLTTGKELTLSRKYRDAVFHHLEIADDAASRGAAPSEE